MGGGAARSNTAAGVAIGFLDMSDEIGDLEELLRGRPIRLS